ncbi:MAG: hypothetical protein IJ506_05805 [Clostridia bacterium]|nr:hypothetical protein [Clostridia bacterium]
MALEKSKWIWWRKESQKDEYGEFYATYSAKEDNQKFVCRICADGDYALYINGQFVASNQYDDYPDWKCYDELDLSAYTKKGENSFAVLVWRFGETHFSYIPMKKAGVIFEVRSGCRAVLVSDENVRARKSSAYQSGRMKKITPQLGYGYRYDATKEDDWKTGGGAGFNSAVAVENDCNFAPRPIKKSVLLEKTPFEIIKTENDGKRILIDMKAETVGLFTARLKASEETELLISYGEHIEDGWVRRLIGVRDFSFEYKAKAGENEFFNPFLRLGARYLEINADKPIELIYAGLIPQVYPVKRKQYAFENELDQKIFETSVKTLELCMMEHYVDCPWREQGLYVLDSRNQMLYGYYAFENGNADYVRANLALMGHDNRADGLTSICFPTAEDLTIPSFTLYWFMSTREYVERTGDLSLVKEIYPKLTKIVEVFRATKREGLLCQLRGEAYWNFYDWTAYLCGRIGKPEEKTPDVLLNSLYILALKSYQYFSDKLGKKVDLSSEIVEMERNTKAAFWREEYGAFSLVKDGNTDMTEDENDKRVVIESKDVYTQLGNALAVCALELSKEEKKRVAEKLVSGEMLKCALSMRGFVYDALIAADEEKYRAYILEDLRKDFKYMLEKGATSFWETLDGAAAFADAGSLCHGWSAIPVYYFVKFGVAKEM